MTTPDIARLVHETNRTYCAIIGDHSQVAWEDAPEWQRDSVIAGVVQTLADPNMTPRKSHEGWLAVKEKAGWTYGPVKDADRKTHPAFVPYDELPPEQRVKDTLFLAVVRAVSQ